MINMKTMTIDKYSYTWPRPSLIEQVNNTVYVEFVAQVIGRRTQDQRVPGLNPETGLNFKVPVKFLNRVPHEPPITQR